MLITNLAILVLAGFVGFAVISKVPNTLHTPLMSGTNAIHGIVLLGGLIVLGLSGDGLVNKVLLVIAIAFGTINVVGGFLVTDRMLGMFKSKPEEPATRPEKEDRPEKDDAKAEKKDDAKTEKKDDAKAEKKDDAKTEEKDEDQADKSTDEAKEA